MPSFQQSVGQNQSQKQAQKLKLSMEMRQALEVLRMPMGELCAYIDEQTQENPMLEMSPSFSDENVGDFAVVRLLDESAGEALSYRGESEQTRGHAKGHSIGGAFALDMERFYSGHNEESLSEALREQLLSMKLDDFFNDACNYLIDCLDSRGYLRFSIDDLAQETGASAFELTQALYLLQSINPAGVAARNLEECLILQLVRGSNFSAATIRLVKDGLELLAENNIKAIAKLLQCSVQDAERYAAAIRQLNPIPAQGYGSGHGLSQIVPDARVARDGDGFRVEMNKGFLPKLEFNAEYCALLSSGTNKETAKYLKKQYTVAKSLVQAIGERESTLAKIILLIVAKQPQYFANGKGLQPMIMAELALTLGINVSTVSRALQDKYIVCSAGTVPLKALFTQGISGRHGPVSSAIAQEKISMCIQSEDKANPLSDEFICRALQAMGIDLSRRTVAKYREEMGILSSAKRRRV